MREIMQIEALKPRRDDRDRLDDTACRFSPAMPRLPGVTAGLAYLAPTTERSYNYRNEPPAGTARQNCEYRVSPVRIMDARAMASPPSIHAEGFELWDAPSAVVDFTDEDEIRNRYCAEAAEIAKYVTGADHAYIFDHLVRRRKAGRPNLTFGRHGDGSRPGAAGRVHADYSEASGKNVARLCREYGFVPTRRAGSVVCARGAIAPSALGTIGAASRLVKHAQPAVTFARPNFPSTHRSFGC
jgi:hypothetical protein